MGCGASIGSAEEKTPRAAPVLHQYYKVVIALMEEDLQSVFADPMKFLMMSEVEKKEYREHRAQNYEEALVPLIKQAFDYYDSHIHNGLLDRQESSQLFKHLVSENHDLTVAITRFAVLETNDTVGKKYMAMRRSGLAFQDRPVVAAVMEKKSHRAHLMQKHGPSAVEEEGLTEAEMIAWAKVAANLCMEEYIADKAARDAAAFKVLDRNGDGHLQKEEVMAVFTNPEGSTFKRLLQAMGVDGQTFNRKLHELRCAEGVSVSVATSAEKFKANVMAKHPEVFSNATVVPNTTCMTTEMRRFAHHDWKASLTHGAHRQTRLARPNVA